MKIGSHRDHQSKFIALKTQVPTHKWDFGPTFDVIIKTEVDEHSHACALAQLFCSNCGLSSKNISSPGRTHVYNIGVHDMTVHDLDRHMLTTWWYMLPTVAA